MQPAYPEYELYGIIDNINAINRLMRVCLDQTDQANLVDHRQYLVDATDLILQQVDIARDLVDDVQLLRKPKRRR